MSGGPRPPARLASEQYPGHHLSIIEALNVVSMKLSQADVVSRSLALPMIQSFEQAMSKALAMVRRHLNSHISTIRRIPFEILIMITSYLKVNAALITKVTHVCHHWRSTLLSCPELWTYPDFSRERQALSFLDRSKSLPIHVDLTKTPPPRSLVKLLCLHATRVDALKINSFDGLQKLFRQPLASLRTLEVAKPGSYFFQPPVARHFPTLTSLTVEHNPGALVFRGALITHLHLLISDQSLEVAALPNLFRSCVLLEKLEIEDEGVLESNLRLLPNEAIPFPHLRFFMQTSHWGQHRAGIINNLSLPPSCSIVLRCMVGHTTSYPPLDLPNLRDTSYFTNLKRLKIVHTRIRLDIEASATLDFINDKGTRLTAITEFKYFHISPSDRRHPKDDRIEPSFPGIEVLCVDGHKYVSLKSFRSLTTLVLSGSIVQPYIEILGEPRRRNACKSLHTLVLFIAPRRFSSHLLWCLLVVAQIRAEAGIPFRAITFVYPSAITSDDLETLEELRGCVERVELLLGDDALDWNLDKYFLKGL